MGRYPLSKNEKKNDTGLKKGAWSAEEDQKLIAYIQRYGIWNWTYMPKAAGLARSGKSCRLRWLNYLRPNIKHGNFSKEEEEAIIKWQQLLGNRWSTIAKKLPGRTDNEIKNYWNTRIKKRMRSEKSMQAHPPNHPGSRAAAAPPPNTNSINIDHPNIFESLSQKTVSDWSTSTRKALEFEETSENSSPSDRINNRVGDPEDSGRSTLSERTKEIELDLWEKIVLSPLEDAFIEEDFEAMFMLSSKFELHKNYLLPESSTDGYLIYGNLWGY